MLPSLEFFYNFHDFITEELKVHPIAEQFD